MPQVFAESMQQINQKLFPELMETIEEIVEDEIKEIPANNK